jgi:hypothetical protein
MKKGCSLVNGTGNDAVSDPQQIRTLVMVWHIIAHDRPLPFAVAEDYNMLTPTTTQVGKVRVSSMYIHQPRPQRQCSLLSLFLFFIRQQRTGTGHTV